MPCELEIPLRIHVCSRNTQPHPNCFNPCMENNVRRIFNVLLEVSGQLVDGDDDINDHNDHVEITFHHLISDADPDAPKFVARK